MRSPLWMIPYLLLLLLSGGAYAALVFRGPGPALILAAAALAAGISAVYLTWRR
ncbi:hypothetical protein [Rubrobacter taiwanensis]|jgi:hypothetical protein|uniref:hypothetical protein n=1 Tax=Rubrobacter taiwanensis TaxID=185139 RepID=UPI001404A6DC|nr:hypothetical protein [Rubrobacter taiwanensis]